MSESMTIPDGLTCGDCRMYPKCAAIIGVKRDTTECDFFPTKFSASAMKFAAYKKDCATLTAEIARLTKALEWYADEANYDDDNAPGMHHWVSFDYDRGERARKALKGEK